MPAWIAAIERSVPEAAGSITFDSTELPFPSEIEHDSLAALGPLPVTPYEDGIQATVDMFRRLAAEGRLVGSRRPWRPSRAIARRGVSLPAAR